VQSPWCARRGNNLDKSLAAADIQSTVIIDFALAGLLAPIDMHRNIRHLRVAGKPFLFHRIQERVRFE
jgi:hypothetical protein